MWLRPVPEQYLQKIRRYDTIVDRLVKPYPPLQFTPRYEMSINGLEGHRPFTLDSTIVLPQSRLEALKPDDRQFMQTLIHERIHIAQRRDQARFDQFYRDVYSLRKSWLPMWNDNPDANNDRWKSVRQHPNETFAYATAPVIVRGEESRETRFLRDLK